MVMALASAITLVMALALAMSRGIMATYRNISMGPGSRVSYPIPERRHKTCTWGVGGKRK